MSTNKVKTLKTNRLSKKYGGRYVVKDVSIVVKQGEVVGLLGPNGAGKTTTFGMIMGFIIPDSGKVFIDNQDITRLPVYKRARLGIGYLSQESSIFRKLTVEENIRAVLEMLQIPPKEIKKRIDELFKRFEIERLRDAKGYTLSGGERRRVEIARALATKPKFLLLDEPFTGIDPIVRAEIQNIILSLKKEKIGILITDHNVRETLEITDKAYLMYDSKILVSGNSHKLVNDSKVRKLYLGEKFKI